MANIIIPHELPADRCINLRHLYKLVAEKSGRREMESIVAEYDRLQALHRNLEKPALAIEARKKLHEAGIETVSDETFEKLWIEQKPGEYRDAISFAIDKNIVGWLERRATPIIRRLKTLAIADLEKSLAALSPLESEIAKRYGLPTPPSQIAESIQAAIAGLREDLNKPLSLAYLGASRGVGLVELFSA